MATSIADNIINDMLTTLNTGIGASAKILVYDGTQPAAGAAPSGNTLLCELTGDATAFGVVASRALTANAITQDASADASGTPTWARITTSGDAYAVDVDAAVGSGTLNFASAITEGQPVSITSLVINAGNA